MCTCRVNHMHAQTHWAQEKDITTKNGPSHPSTTHTHTHTSRTAPPAPTGSDTRSVYMCAHEGGGWWFGERWQSANTEPTKYLCLHNTQGQTFEASCCRKLPQMQRVGRKSGSRVRKKKKMKGVFPRLTRYGFTSPEPVQGRAVDLRRYHVLINTRGHMGENARGPNARINKYRIQ